MDEVDKHINVQIKAYKANRHKDSSSKGMYHIRRLLKGDYNENHQSILGSNQKRRQGYRALEKEKGSDSISKRN